MQKQAFAKSNSPNRAQFLLLIRRKGIDFAGQSVLSE
jgi:hypothetical protein